MKRIKFYINQLTQKRLNIKISIPILTFVVSFICACNKDECPSLFEIPIEISPQKLEYHIGDTITLTSKFYKMVYDRATKKSYDMSEIRWKPFTNIDRLDSIFDFTKTRFNKNIYFVKDLNYKYNIFTFSDGSNQLNGEYNYSNDTFDLKYSLVLKIKGTYIMKHVSANYIGGHFEHQSFKGSCNDGFDVFTNMNNGADNNSILLKDSPDRIYSDALYNDLENRFHKAGGYCFKVLL